MQSALLHLGGAGVMMMLASLSVSALSRFLGVSSPRIERLACVLILLIGWLAVPISIAVPWYASNVAEPLVIETTDAVNIVSDTIDSNPAKQMAKRATPSSDLDETSNKESTPGNRYAGFPVSSMLFVGWLLGGMIAILSAAGIYFLFVFRLKPLRNTPLAWANQWREIQDREGVRFPAPLWVTQAVGPLLCRLPLQTVVSVPESMWRELGCDQRETILKHELSHFRRGDIWKNLLICLLALPQWFNPAAWWAVRRFAECGEWLADLDAAKTPAERIRLARTLTQIASYESSSRSHAGLVACQAAYGHPLVGRVQRLLVSGNAGDSVMRKIAILSVLLFFVAAQLIRFELVAQQPEKATIESVKAKIESLKQRMEDINQGVADVKAEAKDLGARVKEKLETLKALAKDRENLSEEAQRRADLLESGEEAKQLKALEGISNIGEEGILGLAFAAKDSPHQTVRREALRQAAELKQDGFPVFAHSFESLDKADKLFLLEQLSKNETPQHLVLYGLIAKDAEPELFQAVLDAGVKLRDRTVFLAMVGKEQQPLIGKLLERASEFEGDDGLLLLFAVAKSSNPEHQIKALELAAARGEEGLPVIAPAMESDDPEVRQAVVKAAKKIGGDVADFVIKRALADEDETLRQAAEEALN